MIAAQGEPKKMGDFLKHHKDMIRQEGNDAAALKARLGSSF